MNNIVFGFDFGLKYIGIAVGEFITYKSWPLKTFISTDKGFNLNNLDKLVAYWNPCKFVVGISFGYYKNDKTIFLYVKNFEKLLYDKYKIPVYEINENFTTWESKNIYKTKNIKKGLYKKINSLTAAIILEDWLQGYCNL